MGLVSHIICFISVHTAAAYSRVATAMFRALDEKNPSLLDSLKSSFGNQQPENQGFPTSDSPAVTTVSPPSCPDSLAAISSNGLTSDRHDCQDGPKENSWDPLENYWVTFDASALNLPFFTIFDPSPTCLPASNPFQSTHQNETPNNPAGASRGYSDQF
jgi:hypothetical protein